MPESKIAIGRLSTAFDLVVACSRVFRAGRARKTPVRISFPYERSSHRHCSFADVALLKNWYPRGLDSKDRLRYYAEHFDTVEIDSTYYRLPGAGMSAGWAERTPPGFLFHVKAFG